MALRLEAWEVAESVGAPLSVRAGRGADRLVCACGLAEQSVDVPVPQESGEVIQPVPEKRIKDRIADRMVGIPVVAAVQEVMRLVPQERNGSTSKLCRCRWSRQS